jgi:hypothetical protein
VQEEENGEIAWVKFTTAYEEQPETFKLIKKTETGRLPRLGWGRRHRFKI